MRTDETINTQIEKLARKYHSELVLIAARYIAMERIERKDLDYDEVLVAVLTGTCEFMITITKTGLASLASGSHVALIQDIRNMLNEDLDELLTEYKNKEHTNVKRKYN